MRAPWSDPTSEDLLGLAVDALVAGDGRGLLLVRRVLGRECGEDFAETVCGALAAGVPPGAFDFLPEAKGRPDPSESAGAGGVPVDASVAEGAQAAASADAARCEAAAPADAAPPEAAAEGARPEASAWPAETPQTRAAGPNRAPVNDLGPVIVGRPVPPALPDTGFITVGDVALHFGVSVKAVYRWMASGRIRSEKRPGGSYRIPADQFHG